MQNVDIGFTGLALSGLLVAVTLVITFIRKLGLAREIITASIRAAVQLLLVGLALGLVVNDDDPLFYSLVWIVAMIAYASFTVGRRASEVPGIWKLATLAFTSAWLVGFTVFFGLGIFELTGRTLVPLSGMLIGNALNATVLVARRLVAEAQEQRDLIEGRLALGLTSDQAFATHLRKALRTSLIPQIETTKAVGIVFLPGAMVGLILAGVDPGEAVRIQAAVMFMVLGSVATTTTVMGLGITRKLFTKDHRLTRIAMAADGPAKA